MVSSRDSQIIELWLQRQASPHTRGCYRRDGDRLLAHVSKPLSRLTLGDLQSFAQSLTEAGLAPISRARTLAAIKSLFGFCQRMRYVRTNPAAELALPCYEKRLAERIVGEEDVRRLVETDAKPRDRVLLRLLYAAGLRVSEACGLLWRNVRPRGDSGLTVFGKNGRTRSIALTAGLWSELTALRGIAGAEEPVFPSRNGKLLERGRVRVIVRRAANRAALPTPLAPIGCATPTLPTPWTTARPSIWFRPRSAIAPLPRPATTCMHARAIPALASSPWTDSLQNRVESACLCFPTE